MSAEAVERASRHHLGGALECRREENYRNLREYASLSFPSWMRENLPATTPCRRLTLPPLASVAAPQTGSASPSNSVFLGIRVGRCKWIRLPPKHH